MNVERELPRYKCHKEVWALKIAEIVAIEAEDFVTADARSYDGAMIYPEEEGYGPFQISQEYIDRHKPEVGGYYVVYADGYKSWSPAEAFEDGYTLIA